MRFGKERCETVFIPHPSIRDVICWSSEEKLVWMTKKHQIPKICLHRKHAQVWQQLCHRLCLHWAHLKRVSPLHTLLEPDWELSIPKTQFLIHPLCCQQLSVKLTTRYAFLHSSNTSLAQKNQSFKLILRFIQSHNRKQPFFSWYKMHTPSSPQKYTTIKKCILMVKKLKHLSPSCTLYYTAFN